MNIRQEKYKSNRLLGMTQYAAARAAGYSETRSRQACRIEKLVKASIIEELEIAGVTDKVQAREIAKLVFDKDKKIALAALKLVSELKKQLTNDIKIDQSKHYTKVLYEFKEPDSPLNGARIFLDREPSRLPFSSEA